MSSIANFDTQNSLTGINEIDADVLNVNTINSTGDANFAGNVVSQQGLLAVGTISTLAGLSAPNLQLIGFFSPYNYTIDTTTGLSGTMDSTITGNTVQTGDITADTICSVPSANIGYLANTTSNIQNQIDAINTGIANGDGGAFVISGEHQGNISTGYVFLFGANATALNAQNQGLYMPDCYLMSAKIDTGSNPTTAISVYVMNGTIGYSPALTLSTSIKTNTITFSTPVPFALGDILNLNCTAGAGGGGCRISLLFYTKGVIGASPTLSIGSTTTLSAGSPATVDITGTSPVYSIDFGIPEGIQGEAGTNGITPNFTIGTTTTLSGGSSAIATITGTTASPILNLGIPAGITGTAGTYPNLYMGTITTLVPSASAYATFTGTSPNYTLAMGIPQGFQPQIAMTATTTVATGNPATSAITQIVPSGWTGIIGDNVWYMTLGIPVGATGTGQKGDKGDPGSKGDTGSAGSSVSIGDIINLLISAGFLAGVEAQLAGIAYSGLLQMISTNAGTSATGIASINSILDANQITLLSNIDGRLTTLEDTIDPITVKLQYISQLAQITSIGGLRTEIKPELRILSPTGNVGIILTGYGTSTFNALMKINTISTDQPANLFQITNENGDNKMGISNKGIIASTGVIINGGYLNMWNTDNTPVLGISNLGDILSYGSITVSKYGTNNQSFSVLNNGTVSIYDINTGAINFNVNSFGTITAGSYTQPIANNNSNHTINGNSIVFNTLSQVLCNGEFVFTKSLIGQAISGTYAGTNPVIINNNTGVIQIKDILCDKSITTPVIVCKFNVDTDAFVIRDIRSSTPIMQIQSYDYIDGINSYQQARIQYFLNNSTSFFRIDNNTNNHLLHIDNTIMQSLNPITVNSDYNTRSITLNPNGTSIFTGEMTTTSLTASGLITANLGATITGGNATVVNNNIITMDGANVRFRTDRYGNLTIFDTVGNTTIQILSSTGNMTTSGNLTVGLTSANSHTLNGDVNIVGRLFINGVQLSDGVSLDQFTGL